MTTGVVNAPAQLHNTCVHIVIDGRWYSWTGIGRITRELLAELPQLDKKNKYTVLLSARDFEAWMPPAENFQKILADYAPYSLAEQLILPWKLYQLRPDIVHFLSFNRPLLYFGRAITSVNDLTLMRFKNLRGSGLASQLVYELKFWLARLVMWWGVHFSTNIITISRFVAGDLAKHYHLRPSKITVTYPAVNLPTEAEGKLPAGVSSPFLFYIGNAYPHKNLNRLLDALVALRSTHPDLSLVMAGDITVGNSGSFYQEVKERAHELGLDKAVVFLGRISDAELVGLYQAASAYVFPSLSEGFGLPGLEAMSYGCPVVSSNATCLPEVYGQAAHYFNPADTKDMARAIGEVVDDDSLRQSLVEDGRKQVKKYSWRQMAEQTLSVYKALN